MKVRVGGVEGLVESVLWFVVRINNPTSVTSVAARTGRSGDKRSTVFPVSAGSPRTSLCPGHLEVRHG